MKLGLFAGLAALALPAVAQAGHVHWGLSFGIGIGPSYVYPAYRYCPPPPPVTYYAPPPAVYLSPAPVYAPPPVVYEPPPVVYSAPVYDPPVVYFGIGGGGWHYDRFYHREHRYYYRR